MREPHEHRQLCDWGEQVQPTMLWFEWRAVYIPNVVLSIRTYAKLIQQGVLPKTVLSCTAGSTTKLGGFA